MKFSTCCSNKIETQTVEPQVLPEQNDRRQASQTHNIEDTIKQVLYGNVIEFKKKYSFLRISLYLEALRNPLIRTIFHNIAIFFFQIDLEV